MRMRFLIVLIVLLNLCPIALCGDVTYDGTHIQGLYKWMYIQPTSGPRAFKSYVVNGISFDPTQKSVDGLYNRIYWVSQVDYNDVLEGELTTEGLYWTDIYSGVTSWKLALAGYDMPQDTEVDANGVVYAMSGDDVEWLFRITNAASGDPTLVQMLANNYSGIADDDAIGIGMVPQNFGGNYEAGKDIVLFDNGFTSNNNEAVHVVDKTSLAATPTYTTLWQDNDSTSVDIRGAVNYVDGYAYFARVTIPTDNSGSGTKAYINRINGNAVLQRIFMNVNGGTILSTTLDDSIAANPIDGSVWIYVNNYNGISNDRALYRVDAANATLVSGTTTDYIANTTLEMTLTGRDYLGSTGVLNLSKNDMKFSPDGKLLVLATGDSYDRMFIFKTDAFTETPPVTYGSHIYGLYKSFYVAPESTMFGYAVSGMAFDQASIGPDGKYDKLYWLNRTDDGKQGLYLANVYSGTTGEVLALNDISEGAYDVKTDASGNAFVCYTGSSALYKLADLTSGSPVVTRMLGNYGFATSGSPSDDDPASIAFVPTGFGGGFTAGQDIIVFDSGLDMDVNEAVSVIDSTSTLESQVYTTLWVDSDGLDNNIRGDASNIDGYAYFVRGTIPTDNSGSGTKAYVNRIKGDGVLQRIFVNVGGGTIATLTLDDAIAINPADGSLWINTCDTTVSEYRYVYRVDVVNATLISGTDYMANATLEITLPSPDGMYNVGINSMTFSPDGKLLVIGSPTGQDMINVFSTEAFSTAPVNCADAIGKGYSLTYDLDNDCKVNFTDFALMANNWFECIDPANSNCSTPWE